MRQRTIIVLAALTLVIAACGDDDSTTGTTATATETTSEATTAPADTTAPDATATDADDSDIQELLELYQSTPLRTTYLIGSGDSANEVILAQDPTATPPVESIVIPETNTTVIISGGMTVLCDGSAGQCFEVPGSGGESLITGMLGPISSTLTALDASGVSAVETSQEPVTIAGRDGICFTYEPPAATGVTTDFIRQCIDNELGFALLMETSESDSDEIETLLELLDFAEPTAADFETPFPVTASP